MTPARLAYDIRFRTRTNSSTFTDADILALAEKHMDMLALEIIEANVGGEDYFGLPQTLDLVASNDDFANREYPLPADLLNRFLRAEANLGGKWVKLKGFDLSSYDRPTDEETTLKYFSNEEGKAFFDIFRNSLWIYSGEITVVEDGLKIWTYTWPAFITNLSSTTDMSIDPSSTTHGFPRALHPILADLIVIDYKQSREKPIPLTENEQNVDMRKRKAIASLKNMNKDQEIIGHLPPESFYGNSGQDY